MTIFGGFHLHLCLTSIPGTHAETQRDPNILQFVTFNVEIGHVVSLELRRSHQNLRLRLTQ
jgi:hypothetical protein